VRLRAWTDADRAPFAELNADPEVMRYFPSLLTRDQSDALADRIDAFMAQYGWGFWATEVPGSDDEAPQFIGFVGLNIPAATLPFNPCVEVGWRLARPYWGQGLATEAARIALRVGFDTLGLQEIVAFTTLANAPSRAVMQRLNMVESAAEQFDHPSVPADSPVRPHCLYRLPRARWTQDDTC